MAEIKRLGFAGSSAPLTVERGENSGPRLDVDSAPALLELEALRAYGDVASPEQAAPYFGPLVKLFRGDGTSGDHLRAPSLPNRDARSTRGAMDQLLELGRQRVDLGGAGPKEERMLALVAGLRARLQEIDQRLVLREEGR